MKIKSNVRG